MKLSWCLFSLVMLLGVNPQALTQSPNTTSATLTPPVTFLTLNFTTFPTLDPSTNATVPNSSAADVLGLAAFGLVMAIVTPLATVVLLCWIRYRCCRISDNESSEEAESADLVTRRAETTDPTQHNCQGTPRCRHNPSLAGRDCCCPPVDTAPIPVEPMIDDSETFNPRANSLDTVSLESIPISPYPAYAPLPFQADQQSDVSAESDTPDEEFLPCYSTYRPSVPELDHSPTRTRRPADLSVPQELLSPASPAVRESNQDRSEVYELEQIHTNFHELDHRQTQVHELDGPQNLAQYSSLASSASSSAWYETSPRSLHELPSPEESYPRPQVELPTSIGNQAPVSTSFLPFRPPKRRHVQPRAETFPGSPSTSPPARPPKIPLTPTPDRTISGAPETGVSIFSGNGS